MATSGPGRDQPGHADRRRLHGLGADGRDHRPGRLGRRSARTPSRRPTSAASRCRSPSTTTWSPTPTRSRARSPRRSTSPAPAGPGRCSSTSARTRCRTPRPSTGRTRVDLPGYRPVSRPHGKQIREAARLIVESQQPVLYVGGGVLKARASEELRRLVDLTGAPVVTTLMARGALPDSHPAHLGMPGHARHGGRGHRAAEGRPDRQPRARGSTTGSPASCPASRRTPRSCTPTSTRPRSPRTGSADVPIVGDAKEVLAELVVAVQDEYDAGRRPDYAAWWEPARARGATPTRSATRRRGRRRLARTAVRHRAARRDRRARTRSTSPGVGPAPDVGRAVHQVRAPRHLAQLRRPRHDGLRRAGRDGRQGRPAGRRRSGRSTATAASR